MKHQWIIKTTSFRKTIALLAIVFLQSSFLYSQNLNEVEVSFKIDSVAVVEGSTFTNFLVVNNNTETTVQFQDLAPQEKYPGLLFYPKSDFVLNAGESKQLPLKFIANLDFMKMQSNAIFFTLSYTVSGISKKIEVPFNVVKEEDKSVAVYSFSRENFINPESPQSEILIFVENKGYSQRNIALDFLSLPEGLEIMPKKQIITLEGLEKRLVKVQVSTQRQPVLFPEYYLQIKATDISDKTEISSSRVKLVVLSSNRQIARGIPDIHSSNFAEVIYNNNSSGLSYQQLRGNIEFSPTGNLDGRFNLNTDYYSGSGIYNFYDTWLEIEHSKSILRIGNVQGSEYDYSAAGRGGKIATKIGNNSVIEIIALENIHSFEDKIGFKGKVSYLFDHNPRLSVNTQVANFTGATKINENNNISLEAGLSHEKGLVFKDENVGVSAELNYNTQLNNWDFYSSNSFSSKNYAGLSRGSYFFNQRLGYKIAKNKRGFILYQNSQVQPEYLSFQQIDIQPGATNNYPYYFYSTQLFKFGYQFSINKWNFLFSPEVEKQKSESNSVIGELLAYRIQTNIGRTFGEHGLNITGEYSYSKIASRADWFQNVEATLSYRFKRFSLNGTAQLNPSSVNDLNANTRANQNFVNYNLYTSYTFQAFDSSLSGSVSAGLNYSELYENLNKNVVGNLEYNFAKKWSATGYFNYTQYESIQDFGYSGYSYQYSLGIKRYFTAATSAGNHKVSFQLFEDKNFNGMLDSDEDILADEIIRLDKYVALTDKKGKVTFQNVPKGTYKLHVNESAGARLMMDPLITVDRNIKLNVGLVKNIRISGKLVEVKQAYDVLSTEVTGILVYAKNEAGTVQSAVVNQNNEFEFFLKEGTYQIYIENELFSFTNPSQTLIVTSEGLNKDLLFEYKKKNTTIKVKKF